MQNRHNFAFFCNLTIRIAVFRAIFLEVIPKVIIFAPQYKSFI